MDVVSTVALIVQIGNKLKQSIDKVSHNRRRLKELISDVVEEISDLEQVCQSFRANDATSTQAGFQDLLSSTENLLQELRRVLDACQRLVSQPKRRCLVLVRSGFKSWRMRDSIEEDILRLKEKVKSCRARVISTSSVRTEHSLLVLTSEHRAHVNRVEGLMCDLLVASNGKCFDRSLFPDDTPPDSIEYQYFRLQIKKVCESLANLAATQTFPQETPSGVFIQTHIIRTELPKVESGELPSLESGEERLQRAVLETLTILRLVRRASSGNFEPTTIQDGAQMLSVLGNCLFHSGLFADSAAIFGWAANLFRTLAKGPHEIEWLTHLAQALSSQAISAYGLPEALPNSYSAVGIVRSLLATATERDHSPSLACLLKFLSMHLTKEGRYHEALACSQEAVSMYRKFAASPRVCRMCEQGGPCRPIYWEGSGEEVVVCSPARAFYRAVTDAYEEATALKQLAGSFANLGRYAEAQIAITEVVSIFRALQQNQGLVYARTLEEVQSLQSGWVVLYKSPPEIGGANIEETE